MSDGHEVPPPNPIADFDRKPVLYRADGMALVRAAGFVPQGASMAVQTSGTTPQLMGPGKKGKGGKKGKC